MGVAQWSRGVMVAARSVHDTRAGRTPASRAADHQPCPGGNVLHLEAVKRRVASEYAELPFQHRSDLRIGEGDRAWSGKAAATRRKCGRQAVEPGEQAPG